MDNTKIQALIERLRVEADRFHKSPYNRGFEDGKRDALALSYSDFIRYEEAAATGKKDGPDDFTAEEIERLYSEFRRNKSAKIIKIERTESGQTLEGVYRVTIEDSKEEDLYSIPESDRPRYLVGWLRGLHEIYRVAMKPFH